MKCFSYLEIQYSRSSYHAYHHRSLLSADCRIHSVPKFEAAERLPICHLETFSICKVLQIQAFFFFFGGSVFVHNDFIKYHGRKRQVSVLFFNYCLAICCFLVWF